jgi:hypothetical protein
MAYTEVSRDRWGRYLFPDPVTGEEVPYTRVTTLAKALDDTYFLDQWKQRQVAKGLAERHDLYTLACATPIEDKKTLNGICKDAMNTLPSRANLGTAVHAATENADRGEPYNLPEEYRADVRAYQQCLLDWGLEPVREYIECVLAFDRFRVGGTADRFLRVTEFGAQKINERTREEGFAAGTVTLLQAGDLIVGDVKTGGSVDFGGSAMPIQLASYANAERIIDPLTNTASPAPEVNEHVGIIFHMPAGEGFCRPYLADLDEGLVGVSLAREVLDWQEASNVRKQTRLKAMGPKIRAGGEESLEAMIDRVTSREELRTLYTAEQHRFTSEHVQYGRSRMEELGL